MAVCTRRSFSQSLSSSALATIVLAHPPEPVAHVDVGADRILSYGSMRIPCVVGRAGIAREKTEGDGRTPAGAYPFRQLFYRSDRIASVETALPRRAIDRRDAWCDDPGAPQYNRLVRLPITQHTEALWRPDHLYDVLIVLGFNDAPVIPGSGSAIFLHVATPGLKATDGCVAIALEPLLALARSCSTATLIDISA